MSAIQTQKSVNEAVKQSVPKDSSFEDLNAALSRLPFLSQLETKLGISKVFIFLGGIVLGLFLVVLFLGPSAFCNSIAFLYPGYRSFKTMQHDNVQDHINWLTYFVIYGLFNVTEAITDTILFWLPYYRFMKLGFLLWCFLPQTMGCKVVYEKLLRPFLTIHEKNIDSSLETIEGSLVQATQEIRGISSEFFQLMASNVVTSFTNAALATATTGGATETKPKETIQ